MTPGARVAAAIEVLEALVGPEGVEKALTSWARGHRFAGSGDRAAIRDYVYAVVRRWRSSGAWGHAPRQRMLGLLAETGIDVDTLFTGHGHAPAPLSADERAARLERPTMSDAERLDVQDWMYPIFVNALGEHTEAALEILKARAPVCLRVNRLKADVPQTQDALAAEGISTEAVPLAETALIVTAGARKVARSAPFRDGWIEVQDAGSQALTDALPLTPGASVLDYCAGGGGKALAMAARVPARYAAWDVAPERMRDIPERAARAGVTIDVCAQPEGRYDLVLCDAPCSGSGAWRRAPEEKWRLTSERFGELQRMQAGILDKAAEHADRILAYATCSLFTEENASQADAFMARSPRWKEVSRRHWDVSEVSDGFFLSIFERV